MPVTKQGKVYVIIITKISCGECGQLVPCRSFWDRIRNSDRGLLLEKWSPEMVEVQLAALEKCSVLTDSASDVQNSRQGNKSSERRLAYKQELTIKYSSRALFIFITSCTADTKDNLIPQMWLSADCTYVNDYHFPIRTEHFSALSWKVLHISLSNIADSKTSDFKMWIQMLLKVCLVY